MVEAFTASEARTWVQSGSIGSTVDGPYRQSYTYDVWDNMPTKWGRSFTGIHLREQSVDYTYSATTGRNNAWIYDNDGRVTGDDVAAHIYDEAGLLLESDGNEWALGKFEYDGDGRKAKKYEVPNSVPPQTFYLRSSVLGQTIAEIEGADGSRKNGFVHADGQLIATQAAGAVFWQHMDASGKSRRTTLAGGGGQGRDEVDPMDVKLDPPNLHQFNQGNGGGGKGAGGGDARVASLMDLRMCDFAGMMVPCGIRDSLQTQMGESPRELNLFWKYGWWSGASYGTAYSYYATHNPFKLLDLRREHVRKRTPPKLSYPKPMTKAEREKKLRENSSVGADENEPQDSEPRQFMDKYLKCSEQVFGNAPSLVPGRAATAMIERVEILEGTDAALLAVTWFAESGFDLDPYNNPNDGVPRNVDIGPVQINLRTWYGTAPMLNGLDQQFGSNQAGGEIFNGNPLNNIRAGARILNSYGQGREAAGRYRSGTGDFSRSRLGIAAFDNRAAEYDRLSPLYNAFFECLKY